MISLPEKAEKIPSRKVNFDLYLNVYLGVQNHSIVAGWFFLILDYIIFVPYAVEMVYKHWTAQKCEIPNSILEILPAEII